MRYQYTCPPIAFFLILIADLAFPKVKDLNSKQQLGFGRRANACELY